MRTLTPLCFAPGSHTPFELSDFLEFSEFLRTVLLFSSSKSGGNSHVSQYLTQLDTVGKMVKITAKHRIPARFGFSSTCFADTDL